MKNATADRFCNRGCTRNTYCDLHSGIELSLTDPAAEYKSSLQRNFLWMLAGNVTYACLQWAILIVIAKLTTAVHVGQFALALAITAPVFTLANQGLRDLQATDASRHFEFADYFGYRLMTTGFALCGVWIIMRVFGYPSVVLWVGFAKALEAISDVFYGLYQQRESMRCMAISMVLRGLMSVTAVATLTLATHSIEWAAAGLVISTAAVLLLHDARQLRALLSSNGCDALRLMPEFNPRTLYGLAWLAFPLGVAQALNSIAITIPRYVLERYAGPASLGIFAAVMYVVIAGRTFIGAISQACIARLSQLYASRDRAGFRSLWLRQVLIAVCFGAAGLLVSVFCGGPLLSFVYRPEYAEHSQILVLAMVVGFINYLAEFASAALTAIRYIKIQPALLAACAITSSIASATLIPRFGLSGAACAVLITGAVQLALYITALYKPVFVGE
jgi:O-antigen/teichoic acid export membrane protein